MSTSTDPITRGGTPHDCVKSWDDELTKVKNVLKLKEAKTDRAKKVMDNARAWENILEAYWENVKQTNKLCRIVSDEVVRFRERLQGVEGQSGICAYTNCTVTVTEAFYCLVEDFYIHTDGLKTDLSAFITRIDCLNNPEINPKSSKIYACLKELATKLDAAIMAQKEVIKKLLDIVKSARTLNKTACAADGGLEDKLEDLYSLFNTPDTSDPIQRPTAAYGRGCQEERDSCNEVIDPTHVMPLDCGDENSYYKKIKQQAVDAEKERIVAEEEYEKLRIKRDALRSSKKSLESAKQAAEAAKSCK